MEPINDFLITCTFTNPLHLELHTPLRLLNHDVGVKFISIPSEFYNIPKSTIELRLDGEKIVKKIAAGYYATVSDLVDAINATIASEKIQLVYDNHTATAQINLADARCSIKLSSSLADMLRLPTGTIKSNITSHSNIFFSGEDATFYIKTDFTVPQLCNNQTLPVIGLAKSGTYTDYDTYVDVKPGTFHSISINITSTEHIPINFLREKVNISLHFRQKQF